MYDTSGDENNLVTFGINDGAISTIAPISANDLLSGGDFVNGVLTGVDYANEVYFIDGGGAAYKVGDLTGDITSTDAVATGMAFDSGTNKVYVSAYSQAAAANLLYSADFDLNTTLVGNITGTSLIIGIAVDNNGNLYGIDIADDNSS